MVFEWSLGFRNEGRQEWNGNEQKHGNQVHSSTYHTKALWTKDCDVVCQCVCVSVCERTCTHTCMDVCVYKREKERKKEERERAHVNTCYLSFPLTLCPLKFC